MKKSRKIQLVLITAALASCNRAFLPPRPFIGEPVDPGPIDLVVSAPSAYYQDRGEDTCNLCCPNANIQLWDYSFIPSGSYSTLPVRINHFYPTGRYGKGSSRRNNHFIIRGGWGRRGGSASS